MTLNNIEITGMTSIMNGEALGHGGISRGVEIEIVFPGGESISLYTKEGSSILTAKAEGCGATWETQVKIPTTGKPGYLGTHGMVCYPDETHTSTEEEIALVAGAIRDTLVNNKRSRELERSSAAIKEYFAARKPVAPEYLEAYNSACSTDRVMQDVYVLFHGYGLKTLRIDR